MKIVVPLICVFLLTGRLFAVGESDIDDDSGLLIHDKGSGLRMYTDEAVGVSWYSAKVWGDRSGNSKLIAINYYPANDQFTFFYYFPIHDVPVNQEIRIFIDGDMTGVEPSNPSRVPLENSWLVSETDEIVIGRQLVEDIRNGSDVDFQFVNEHTRINFGISDYQEYWGVALNRLLLFPSD